MRGVDKSISKFIIVITLYLNININFQKYLLTSVIKLCIMNFVGKSTWAISSAGRAPALQAGGRRFDPVIAHHARNKRQETRSKIKEKTNYLGAVV